MRANTALCSDIPDSMTSQSIGKTAKITNQSMFLKILKRLVTHCDFEFRYA